MLGFAGKLLSGIMSMTMMLFSSYEGNNASFSDIYIGHDNEIIRIQTSLISAFENDFEQIFRSGSPIVINYQLNVAKDGEFIESKTYQNIVVFDPMNRFFQIDAEASNYHSFTDSCEELRKILSGVDIYYDHWGEEGIYSFDLSVSMEKVVLESLDREFDLMLLWHHKTPRIAFNYKVVLYES